MDGRNVAKSIRKLLGDNEKDREPVAGLHRGTIDRANPSSSSRTLDLGAG